MGVSCSAIGNNDPTFQVMMMIQFLGIYSDSKSGSSGHPIGGAPPEPPIA